ncbi:MAG: HDIG domain-containing protein [Endomicrobiaceae bacterium]|nr:HDIG domain-containing protein [Endomicrobiaceae bacterium]
MKNLNDWLKAKIKKFLLFLIRKMDEDVPNTPIIRLSSGNILKKDIKIHPAITAAVSFICLYFMLVMQVGATVQTMIGIFILLLLVFSFVLFYFITQFKKSLLDSNKVMLICFIFVFSFLLFQIFSHTLSQIAFPMTAFTVLLSLLISVRVGLTYTFAMAVFMAIINDFSAAVPIIQIAGSFVSIINIRKIRSRTQFTKVGIKVSAAMTAIIISFFLFGETSLEQAELDIWFAVLNGFSSVLIILALLPILENLFSRTTNIKLIELADFNNPLLKRLMVEAPGTYHHSLMTASLAEQAAGAIGINSLLARTCAYYHDIGKLKNPEYFIENQNNNENPHDNLSPSMSGLVLVSHVKDGVALARKYKIDQVIIDAINQHHGTSLIQYFYHRALEQSKDVNEQDFRYPGQKPTTKISAILMIADSIEAISRTMQDTSAGKLKEVVEKVINNKFTDGQFSDCPITLADLVKIAESMTITLCGIYHARIEYKTSERK